MLFFGSTDCTFCLQLMKKNVKTSWLNQLMRSNCDSNPILSIIPDDFGPNLCKEIAIICLRKQDNTCASFINYWVLYLFFLLGYMRLFYLSYLKQGLISSCLMIIFWRLTRHFLMSNLSCGVVDINTMARFIMELSTMFLTSNPNWVQNTQFHRLLSTRQL